MRRRVRATRMLAAGVRLRPTAACALAQQKEGGIRLVDTPALADLQATGASPHASLKRRRHASSPARRPVGAEAPVDITTLQVKVDGAQSLLLKMRSAVARAPACMRAPSGRLPAGSRRRLATCDASSRRMQTRQAPRACGAADTS